MSKREYIIGLRKRAEQAEATLKQVILVIEAHWQASLHERSPSPAEYGELWAVHDRAESVLADLSPKEDK